MSHPVSVGDRADAAPFKHELLARLGLRDDASRRDVEAAHFVLLEFLELMPHDVNSWAAARSADMDEAFALLSGSEQGLISASQRASRVARLRGETPEPLIAAAATPLAPVAHATGKPRRNQLLGAVGTVLVVGGMGVFQLAKTSEVPGISAAPGQQTSAPSGQQTSAPSGQQTSAPSAATGTVAVDKTRVAALMTKTRSNPKDAVSLQELGDIYYAAADYKNAAVFERKILGVDPKNELALLTIGAAQFNLGNAAEAKRWWLVAAVLYPGSAEVHYDLGFLYLSQTPPDKAKMTSEWNKVIAIVPGSAMAKSVAAHLTYSTATPSTN